MVTNFNGSYCLLDLWFSAVADSPRKLLKNICA